MKKLIATCVVFLLAASPANADTAAHLEKMLHEFLAGASVGSVDAHRKFWADDLVYTTSGGVRTDKASILDGMQPVSGEPSVVYSAEEIQINLYDKMAIVAFKLVGTPADKSAATLYYFNTGTFIDRDGRWQVVAWQATRIPEAPVD